MNEKYYDAYLNLGGNIKEKIYGIYYNASLIGIDNDNNIIQFGKINKDYYFDYREDKFKDLFFQRNLEFMDICEENDNENIYYNVIYKYKCNDNINRNDTIFKISTGRCKIEIEIFTRDACQYIKLPIDNFFIEYKYIICLYYIFFSFMLISLDEILFYSVSNAIFLQSISFIIAIYFSLDENVIVVPFVLSIFISIGSVSFIIDKLQILNRFILCTVSGFCCGIIIIEIIFSYFSLLNIFEILIIFIIFIFLSVLSSIKLHFIIYSSFIFAYINSNIYIIWIAKKLPIFSIIHSLINEGFDIEQMSKFRYQKNYIYFLIYIFSFIVFILSWMNVQRNIIITTSTTGINTSRIRGMRLITLN